ncbi:stage V sporulation protein K [Metabacillus iocasae]|uniref:Stage V sporulation protein K n=1 Tax=Priestia iocasae TaxID=2291674 RepID=A0ABS2QR81_9BACI|nr:stage V sporulation protein K [Metabacillus iocasae]MBM7701954.1 stage V sporulation protein K [Metabacillus iocasae]
MDQPITLKNNGQINIILNNETKKGNMYSTSIPQPVKKKKIIVNHEPLKDIEKEMESLIGMEELKKIVKEIYAWLYINKKREEAGLKAGKQALHMMFKGNPGTGKTTVARLLGKLFLNMNVLTKGHLIEAERADLVGEYIGHTAQKTRDLIKKAMGGILFIDEAYSLARGGEKDFGKEAIDTLVNHMEAQRENFILILAGYPKEMDNFLSLNPGLRSRFPFVLHFPDYEVKELMDIGMNMLDERQYTLSTDAYNRLKDHFMDIKYGGSMKDFSNGRYVRNVIELSIRKQAMRLLEEDSYTKDDLLTLKAADIQFK